MSKKIEQTLFIPDLIEIKFVDKKGEPFRHADILFGVQTRAYYRNDIDISPFLSNSTGKLSITRQELQKQTDDVISEGIMDYVELDFARPAIEIYYMGNRGIRRYLGLESDPAAIENLKKFIPGFNEAHFTKQQIEQHKNDKNYAVFNNCYNRSLNIEDNIILAKDDWSKPQKKVSYICRLPVDA